MSNKGWTEDKELTAEGVTLEGPPPLENGFYHFTIAEVTPQLTSKNNPAVKVKLQIDQKVGGDAVKRTVYDTVVIMQETYFKVLQLANATGTEPPKRSGSEFVNAWADALIDSQGGYCRLTKSKPDENGRIYSRVDGYYDEARLQAAMQAPSDAPVSEDATPRRRRRAA